MRFLAGALVTASIFSLSGCSAYDASEPGAEAVYESIHRDCGNLDNYSQSLVRLGSDDEAYFYRIEAGGQVGEVYVRHWPDRGEWVVQISEDLFVSSWGCSGSYLHWRG